MVATPGRFQNSSDASTTVVVWPDRALPNFLIFCVLVFLVLKFWSWSQPCDTCGEFKEQCRCKAPEYSD